MVVDDDAETRATLKKFLERSGHHVICAGHGKEGLEMLASQQPDVVVLDVRMPLVDGIGFLEVLRCYLRWQNLPVIMLTAFAEGDHIQRAAELGVRRVFVKSHFALDDLAAEIDRGSGGTGAGSLEHHQGWFRYLRI